MPFDREKLQTAAAALAQQGVFMGTSSWKYPGWRGQLYEHDRYVWRGRFSEARFDRLCLSEYAQVLKSVCIDAAYYQFPTCRYLEQLVAQVTPDFQFALKVTDQVTIKRFPNLPRFGARAATVNSDFLNPDRFESHFLEPCRQFQPNIGLLMFEFSRFSPQDFAQGRDFVAVLDQFLEKLPRGWRYGVEIRNPSFLQPPYFEVLARHGVAHVFNSWQGMPSLSEQMALPGSRTNPALRAARLLLRPGRKYEEAVKMFSPYDRIQDPYPEGQAAGARLVAEGRRLGKDGRTFIYVNNRFEGNALHTIASILEQAGAA